MRMLGVGLLAAAVAAFGIGSSQAGTAGPVEIICDVDRTAFRGAASGQSSVTFQLWPTAAGGSPCDTHVLSMTDLVVIKAKTDRYDAATRRKFAEIRAALPSPVQVCSGGETWLDVVVGSTTLGCDFSKQGAAQQQRRKLVNLPFVPSDEISARVYNSTYLSIPNNTETTLTFDSERWDTDEIHSTVSNTSRLTAPTAGKYFIYAHVRFSQNPTGRRLLRLKLGAPATHLATQDAPGFSAATDSTFLSVSTHYQLAAGDYVEAVVIQSSGGQLDVIGDVSDSPPEVGMVKLP